MADSASGKRPFDIDDMIARLRDATAGLPKAALFQLRDDGHASVFEQLVACIVSIRTRDETTLPTARSLFTAARTPEAIVRLSEEEIDRLIAPSTFHRGKAKTILEIARVCVSRFGGVLPCDEDVLRSFSGVGPKCANLTVGVACGKLRVSADVHVHRVANRWGYVSTSSPERTGEQLEKLLPIGYRVEINSLLVPFGKHICTGTIPRCTTCALLPYCRQVGVDRHR